MNQDNKIRLLIAAYFLVPALLSGCVGSDYQKRRQYREMPLFSVPSDIKLGIVVAEGPKARVPSAGKYRGKLEVARKNGATMVINRVSIDDYVKGVMNGEVAPSWPAESLRAMAIVVRSYAYYSWEKSRDSKNHMYADVRSQKYCGRTCEDSRSNSAVDQTAGLVMVFRGKAVQGFSHSNCAGHTESIREVWGPDVAGECFAGRECPWCRASRHYGPWTAVIEKTALSRRLAPDIGRGVTIRKIRVVEFNESGRVRTVELATPRKKIRMSGSRFRTLAGWDEIKSTRFEAVDRGDVVEFQGTGWGHGVGICQEGARKMAEDGKDAETILRYYFPGIEIWRLPR